MPAHTMDIKCICWAIILWLTIQEADASSVPNLSKKELILLAEDEDPKCFTRTNEDFTCFWESPVGQTYEFFYHYSNEEERLCNLTKQQMEDERVLHICSFHPDDVFLFDPMHIRVVEKHNMSAFTRLVSVEDQFLQDPPENVTLSRNGNVGQLKVWWRQHKSEMQHEIRYSSKSQPMTAKQIFPLGRIYIPYTLSALVPGEVSMVQLRNKLNGYSFKGPWSDWSDPTFAMVPQDAGDIEFRCHTSDLRQVRCQWNEDAHADANYSLYYKHINRNVTGNWSMCPKSEDKACECILHGNEKSMFSVYLSAGEDPLCRTFYLDPFKMNTSIKTEMPGRLEAKTEGGRLCLRWDSPLPAIIQHMMYQIQYQLWGDSEWKMFTVAGPKTSTCLDVQRGSRYTIQVKAKPNGYIYNGQWSEWSNSLTIDTASNTVLFLATCVPMALLIISVVFISLFPRYLSLLKQYLWPPVPNLNSVLESFFKDINGQHWDPTFRIKECADETLSSVVEIMSEKEIFSMEKSSKGSCLITSNGGLLGVEGDGETTGEGLEVGRDYVTLNTSDVILRGNEYVYRACVCDQRGDGQYCSCARSSPFPDCSTDILNCSYQVLAEQPEVCNVPGTARRYANLTTDE